MHRWFSIKNAEKDLKFEPVIGFEEGWSDMAEWFKQEWLPKQASRNTYGIAQQSQAKIDIQAGKSS